MCVGRARAADLTARGKKILRRYSFLGAGAVNSLYCR